MHGLVHKFLVKIEAGHVDSINPDQLDYIDTDLEHAGLGTVMATTFVQGNFRLL